MLLRAGADDVAVDPLLVLLRLPLLAVACCLLVLVLAVCWLLPLALLCVGVMCCLSVVVVCCDLLQFVVNPLFL